MSVQRLLSASFEAVTPSLRCRTTRKRRDSASPNFLRVMYYISTHFAVVHGLPCCNTNCCVRFARPRTEPAVGPWLM